MALTPSHDCKPNALACLWLPALPEAPLRLHAFSPNRHLCKLIEAGKAKPSFIVSHELPLAQAPEGYRHFDARDAGWTKVVLTPTLD